MEIYFLAELEAKSLRSGYQYGRVLVRALFHAHLRYIKLFGVSSYGSIVLMTYFPPEDTVSKYHHIGCLRF